MVEGKRKILLKICKAIRPPSIDILGPLGYFDGEIEEEGLKCGAGALIKSDNSQKY